MDPVLSSLLKTNQIGADGFNWWIGQVETSNTDDPKKSGRYRVRIVGHHLKSGQATPTKELPWAQVMMPVTTPFTDGGVTGATVNLQQGNWVLGFFLDNDKQKPIILGSIGHTAGATEVLNQDPNPNAQEKGFTTYTHPKTKPEAHRSVDSPDGKDPKTKANTDGGEPAAARSHEENGAPAIIAALRGKYSEANPIGCKTCVTIANPKCGNESNFGKQLTNVVGDMLAANQAAGGQIGDFYVSKVNGFLYDKVNIARYHIARVTRLVRSLLGRIQSEIIKKIREGIEAIIKAVLGTNVPEEQKEKTPVDPKQDFDRVKGRGNILKRVKKILDKILQALGCAIEDATDRLVQWLTDLLFGFIMDVFSPAVCSILNLVDGIINQILAIIDGLISKILGPIQAILSIIGGGLNIVGSIINKVMSFLGITCSGPSGKCAEQTVVCNDCGTDEDEEDFLDRLLKEIEAGDDGGRFNCEESQDYLDPQDTKVTFVGGIPTTDTPEIPDGGSIPERSLDPEVTIPDSFFPSTAQDPAEDPNIIPSFEDAGGDIFEGGTPDLTPYLPPEDGDDDPLDDSNLPEEELDLPLDPGGDPYYSVVADPTTVTEGDVITYTIRTSNVPFGTVLNYTLSGETIIPEYIVGGSLTGSFTILEDSIVIDETVDEEGEILEVEIPIGIAIVQVQIAEDNVLALVDQEMIFTIDDTEAFATVTIVNDAYPSLNPEYDPNFFGFPNYEVTTDKELYYEGEDIIFTITTQNVPDGTKLSYAIFGDIDANDFIQDSLTGTFTIRNNTARVVAGIVEDLEEEFDESVYFSIVGTGAGASVVIVGTAVDTGGDGGAGGDGLNRPTTGDPITDENGSIISIPVKDRGDKYNEAPFVIITGEGFGATAIALLDNEGFVSEIRVTRGGLGYKVNRSADNNLRCVIDSFTLISPGIRYTSPPSVYINGKLGIAEAEIDSRGYVVSVRVLDRKTVFSSMPKVTIIGGGGAGAIAIPSLVCLDGDELERRGYVKIGTGRYIDCP